MLKTGHETAKVGSMSPKKKCGSNYQGWQFYGHFFKLPNMAGLPKWQDQEQAGAELCQAQVKLKVIEEAWS